jgi:hypothetical protein
MIGMGMGDVDCGQALAEAGNPIRQIRRVRLREERIDQQGIPLAINQRGRVCDPRPCPAAYPELRWRAGG